MIGTTLEDIRSHIEDLASEDGAYYLRCARYGDRPVPAAGLRFESRTTARAAARATEQYRSALRRYDPTLPFHDVIVCQERRETVANDGSTAEPSRTDPAAADDRPELVEFCHRVAAAVFEALSAAGHDAVESAVMDAYFELAETVDDPDDLCLCLLESMAAALDRQLTPTEQADVVAAAADRLPRPASPSHPVAATLALLEARGLLGSATWAPRAADGRERGVVVRVAEYALSPHGDRLPVLPLALELARHQDGIPTLSVIETDDAWEIRLVPTGDHRTGVANVPIRSEA